MTTTTTGVRLVANGAGNAYITGHTQFRFPHHAHSVYPAPPAGRNAFVTELNPAGTALVYSTYLGDGTCGELSDGHGIALDSAGDAFVTGYTEACNFPTTAGAYQTANNAFCCGDNAFMTELNPGGTALVYSTLLGGDDVDEGYSIALDSSDNGYLVGEACWKRGSSQ